jgi:hypothetical protein
MSPEDDVDERACVYAMVRPSGDQAGFPSRLEPFVEYLKLRPSTSTTATRRPVSKARWLPSGDQLGLKPDDVVSRWSRLRLAE